jgi:hypothetical protein
MIQKGPEGMESATTQDGCTGPYCPERLVASGAVDDSLLEALEDYVKRQRKRLNPQNALIEAVKNQGGLEAAVKGSFEKDGK